MNLQTSCPPTDERWKQTLSVSHRCLARLVSTSCLPHSDQAWTSSQVLSKPTFLDVSRSPLLHKPIRAPSWTKREPKNYLDEETCSLPTQNLPNQNAFRAPTF